MLDVKKIRKDFPIFKNDQSLVYLDSTATTLKPKVVIDKLREYYEQYTSNVFRGLYPLSQRSTKEYEDTRSVVAKFINAKDKEVIFTRNTSESLNLVAYCLAKDGFDSGDSIVTTIMEHHSNFVPWQQICIDQGCNLRVVGITSDGNLDMDDLEKQIDESTKLLAVTYVSNVLGTVNPLEEIVEIARKKNPEVIIVVDAAQAIQFIPINVKKLDIDFLAFSSHKILGPTGVGVLWGKESLLKDMPPFLYGGEMIREVGVDKTTYANLPHKYEAGTPAIGEVIALKEAIKYVQRIGLDDIRNHEEEILSLAFSELKKAFGDEISFIGPIDPEKKAAILAFEFGKYHPHDIAEILGSQNVCVRAGHHCAMPLHKELDVVASSRASFYIYNDKEDINHLVSALKKVKKVLG